MTGGDLFAGLADFAGSVLIISVIFILITNVPETELDLSILEKVLLLSITGSIAHALLVTITQDNFNPGLHRLEDYGLAGNSNDLGAIIVQALPFAVIPAMMAGRHFSRRVIALATVPILMTGLWLTQSRGSMMAAMVSVVTYLAIKAKNKKRAVIMISVLGPILFGLYSALNLARNAGDLEGSSESRQAFVIAGINMGIRNPLMGVGMGNFPKVWEGYAIGKVVETGVRTAHNTWVLAFAETGFPGLLLLVCLFVSTFRKGLLTQHTHPELLAALTGYAVAMSFLSHTYTFFPYILFALVIAGAKIHLANAKLTT
jgi:putative inorganic carbon (HCO3(-)) transporter